MVLNVLFAIASAAASSTTATSPLSLIPELPISGSPVWEGTVDPSLYRVYCDMIEALLPVAIVCAVSLLCTAVWLLAAGTHLRSEDARDL